MKVYLEVLIILILLLILFVWFAWVKISHFFLKKMYLNNERKKQKGGVKPRAVEGTNTGTKQSEPDNDRSKQSARQCLLPKTEVNIVGKDSNGRRKTSSSIGKLLRRRNKRK